MTHSLLLLDELLDTLEPLDFSPVIPEAPEAPGYQQFQPGGESVELHHWTAYRRGLRASILGPSTQKPATHLTQLHQCGMIGMVILFQVWIVMAKRIKSLTEILQASIAKAPSLRSIETATGVARLQLRHFRDGKRTLTLRTAEPLMDYFGIKAVQEKPKKGGN